MPAFETMDRTEKALLWETTGGIDEYGQYAYNFLRDPTEIKVRWEAGRRLSSDSQGNPLAVDVMVVANREIATGSLMWLGSLIDLPGTGTAAPESDLMIVVGRDRTKDIKGRYLRWEYMLQRFKNTLPTAGG